MEPFDGYAGAALHGHRGWQALRQNDVQLQGQTVYAGTGAVVVATNAIAWRSFSDTTATNVWIDFYARQSWPEDRAPPTLHGSASACFYIGADGYVRAISNATWVTLPYRVPADTWQRFTVNLNYVTREWALYAADDVPNRLSTPLAVHLAFSASSTNAYFQRFRVKN